MVPPSLPHLPSPSHPLVLTLTLDPPSQTLLTALRAKHFPQQRNHLSAHLTLFHAIPAHRFAELDTELEEMCSQTLPWEIFIGEPAKMGNHGVMVSVRSRPSGSVEGVHGYLLRALKRGAGGEEGDRLTNQDSMVLRRPHVTVLNKAESEVEVERCLEEVRAVFDAMKRDGEQVGQQRGKAIGFELWEYLGGPWKPLKSYVFDGADRGTADHVPAKHVPGAP